MLGILVEPVSGLLQEQGELMGRQQVGEQESSKIGRKEVSGRESHIQEGFDLGAPRCVGL